MMGRIWNSIKELKAAMIMVVVQIAFAVVNIFYKMAANDGMKMTVLIAYRFLFASAFILPLALFLERSFHFPPHTNMIYVCDNACFHLPSVWSENL
ncbi:hypothetical protein ACSBR2_022107 [Camellia fascicularis]